MGDQVSDQNEHLEEAYRWIAAEDLAASGEACPPSGDLAAFMIGESPRKDRKRILAHISLCGTCAKKVDALFQAEREIDDLFRGLPDGAKNNSRKKSWLQGYKLRSLHPVAVGALILAVLAIASFFLLKSRPAAPVWRGQPSEVVLIAPARGAVLSGRGEFVWKSYPGAESYRIELFDPTLSLIWKSEPLAADRISLPERVLALLQRGVSYYWSVSSRLVNGLVVKSKLSAFTIER